MKKMAFLLLVLFSSATLAAATMYSCRDKDGKLFVSDNLQSLPPECRGDKQQISYKDDPDNLNYVPAEEIPAGVGAEFQKEVQQVEVQQEQKKQQLESLWQRVESIVQQYGQLVREKRAAKRSWSYDSRDKIDKADARIAQIREEKQRLLAAIAGQRLAAVDKEKMLSRLAEIED